MHDKTRGQPEGRHSALNSLHKHGLESEGIYRTLDENGKEFRLLSLLPGSFGDQIEVSITTSVLRPLSDEGCSYVPTYEALPYTWGPSENPVEIIVQPSKTEVYVTENLATTLLYLRQEHESRLSWIDALCVNQQDLEELANQVQRMTDIYRNATRVIIFLGPEGNDSTLAMETFSHIGSKVNVDWDHNACGTSSPNVDRPSLLSYDEMTKKALCHFLERPWFHRLWIWQEARLAQEFDICCGSGQLPGLDFAKAVFFLASHGDTHLANDLPRAVLNATYIMSRGSRHSNLKDLVHKSSHALCSDPRDNIFALLSILHPSDDLTDLKPDYTQTPCQIYELAVLKTLMLRGNLDLMYFCEGEGDVGNRPSWVPDLSVPRERSEIGDPRSCLHSQAEVRYISDGFLLVTGLYCAEIEAVEKVFGDYEHDSPTEYYRHVRRLTDYVDIDAEYLTGGNILEALCPALCLNRVAEACHPPEDSWPPLSSNLGILHKMLGDPADFKLPGRPFAAAVQSSSWHRLFFTTKEGYIGLASAAAKPGDQICILLGCQTPILLRKAEYPSYYTVVSECYLHGAMDGTALLGPLHDGWQLGGVMHTSDKSSGYSEGFFNRDSRETCVEDPRLWSVPLPPGWKEMNHEHMETETYYVNDETGEGHDRDMDPRMTADALRGRGVPLTQFNLI